MSHKTEQTIIKLPEEVIQMESYKLYLVALLSISITVWFQAAYIINESFSFMDSLMIVGIASIAASLSGYWFAAQHGERFSKYHLDLYGDEPDAHGNTSMSEKYTGTVIAIIGFFKISVLLSPVTLMLCILIRY